MKIWKFLFSWTVVSSVLKNCCWHEFQGFFGSSYLWAYDHVDAYCVMTHQSREVCLCLNIDCLYLNQLLLITLMFITYWRYGSIQKVPSSWRGGGGSLKSKRKRTRGRGQVEEGGGGGSSLSLRSLCEKNCLIFQRANRLLSEKLLGSC